MQIFVPESQSLIEKSFLQIYYPYLYQGFAESNRREIKKIKQRTCRFCKKDSTRTTFKNDSHIIPKLLGNKNFLSAEECDNCNKTFKDFEDHLAKYLSFNRTISSIPNDKKPIFESANGNIRLKNLSDGILYIERKNLDKDFNFDSEVNNFEISIQSQSYAHSFVYKAFLKMALSILPASEVKEYEYAFHYLLDNNKSSIIKEIKRIEICESNISYVTPTALLFKRNSCNNVSEFPLHTFCLYVKNYMFQIYFPLHNENILRKENKLSMKLAPYVLLNSDKIEEVNVNRYYDEMHSAEASNRNHSIKFNLEENIFNQLQAVRVDIPDDFKLF